MKSISSIFLLAPILALSTLADESDHSRLRRGTPNFLAKLAEGEPVHVAFLGGSITQNQKGHTAMIPAWLKEKYPAAQFTFTNAGLSSTCSTSGAFRLSSHVLEENPTDLLIVEFAVNDDQDAAHSREQAIRGMEGIVRQFWGRHPDGDIIMVHFVNPPILETIQAGEISVSVEAHEAVAERYGIPSVNIGTAIAAEIEAGRKTWKKDYGGTHPNEAGYRFASDLIAGVIAGSKAKSEIVDVAAIDPLDPKCYQNARFVDPQEAAWLGGWKRGPVNRELLPQGSIRRDYELYHALRGEEPGSTLYFSFTGTAFGAFLLAGPDAGIVEVSIDEGEWKPVDTYHRFSEGLNYPRSILFADGLDRRFHQAAIRISENKNPASTGHAVNILRFEVN